jgi:hypothetical protein
MRLISPDFFIDEIGEEISKDPFPKTDYEGVS